MSSVKSLMNENATQKLVRLTRLACASVAVETTEGDQSIGTAFHIGEGVYLTARHVLEGKRIVEILPLDGGHLLEDELKVVVSSRSKLSVETPIWPIYHERAVVVRRPVLSS